MGTPHLWMPSPQNTVLALARYWDLQISLALDWQEANPGTCIRLRYEDLVRDPETTLSDLFEFLGVERDLDVTRRAFSLFDPASGPGDYKLAFTHRITDASVGRGKQVPVTMIPASTRERLSQLLEKLDYPALADSWNAEPRPDKPPPRDARARLVRLMVWNPDGVWEHDVDTIAVVTDDDPELRWIIEPRTGTVRQGDGEVDLVLTGATKELMHLFTGDENPAALLRAGRVRCVSAAGAHEPLVQAPRLITSLARHLSGDQADESR